MTIRDSTRQKIIKSFKPDAGFTPPTVYYRVKVDGQFITTKSGKTVWKKTGHVKNALINHLETCLGYPYICDKTGKQTKDVVAELFEDGTFEIVPIFSSN